MERGRLIPYSTDTRTMSRAPLPPFDLQSATTKVRLAEDAWNTRNPEVISLAYSENSRWRNRVAFLAGRAEIRDFLKAKWDRELDYRLVKELWAYTDNHIAVRFAYEYRDDSGTWYRAYGNENWKFDTDGLMSLRLASINEMPIAESGRLLRWPLGRRPDDHPGLSELGL